MSEDNGRLSSTAAAIDKEPSRVLWGVLWMSGSIACFTIIPIAGRAAAEGVTPIQISIWRTIIGLAILFAVALMRRMPLSELRSGQPRLQVARNVVHFLAQLIWIYALIRLSLAELTAFDFTAPLWIAVLAPMLLGERMTALRLAAVVIGFIGVLIVVRPGAIPFGTGAQFGIAAAFCIALSMIMTKRLLRSDGTFAILFWMQAVQTIFGLAIVTGGWLMGYGPGLVIPDTVTFGWLLAIGVLALAAHLCMTKAFSYADASIIAPLDFLRLPLVAAVGIALYAEPLDPWVLTGGLVVILANILNIRGERQRLRG